MALVVLVEDVVDRKVDVQVVAAKGLPGGIEVVDAIADPVDQLDGCATTSRTPRAGDVTGALQPPSMAFRA